MLIQFSKKITALVVLLLFALAMVAFAKPPSFSKLGFSPTDASIIYNQITGNLLQVTFSVTHKDDPAYVVFGLSEGLSENFSARTAVSTGNNTIDYNIYETTTGNNNIITDNINSTTDWFYGSENDPDGYFYPAASGGGNTYTYTFIVDVPSNQTVLADQYTDLLTLNFYYALTAGGPWPGTPTATVPFNVIITVEASVEIALGAPGFTTFNPGSGYSVSIADMQTGSTASFDAIVKANIGYTVEASSANRGVLKHIDKSEIPYQISFVGGPTPDTTNYSLSSPQGAVLTQDPAGDPTTGTRYNSTITIGSVPVLATVGDYTDTVTFTVTAN